MLGLCRGAVLGLRRGCDGVAMGLRRGRDGAVPGLCWGCAGDVAGVHQGCAGPMPGLRRGCARVVLGQCRRCAGAVTCDEALMRPPSQFWCTIGRRPAAPLEHRPAPTSMGSLATAGARAPTECSATALQVWGGGSGGSWGAGGLLTLSPPPPPQPRLSLRSPLFFFAKDSP